ncbi:MAG: hypothetical protein M3O30_11070 [Planctomycetota bacterium]|nr:hypothetical protein [Planctomycetota bacterium]
MTAYVKADDVAIANQLSRAAKEGSSVTVRCAALEIEGRVGNLVTCDEMEGYIAISVTELRYFKPHRKF